MVGTNQKLPWVSQQMVTDIVSAFTNNHAVLLNGPENIGKSHLAANICLQLLKDSSLLHAGTHPDLHVLTSANSFNQLDVQLQNAASRYLGADALEKKRLSRQIPVENIRSLVLAMSESSGLGGNKVTMICPAEDMNRNAANALLKFLEEPTDQTMVILISHDISKLPATIRSRCMRIDIAVPLQSQSIDWLRVLYPDRDIKELSDVLRLALDRPLLANQYLIDNQQAIISDLTEDIGKILTNTNTNIVPVARDWLKLKQTDFILHWLCCFFSDLIKVKSGHAGQITGKSQRFLAYQMPIHRLFDLYDYFINMNQRYDGVVDEALLVEDMLLKMSAAK